MIFEFLLPAVLVLIFSYFTIPMFQIGVDNTVRKTKSLLTKCPIRSDLCLSTKHIPCPMTNYKQCTNNVKNYPLKCNCQNNRNFDTCQNNERVDEKKFFKKYKEPETVYPNFGKNAPRVNMFNTNKDLDFPLKQDMKRSNNKLFRLHY